jgi:hypothetical protein
MGQNGMDDDLLIYIHNILNNKPMKKYANLDQFINSLTGSEAMLYETYYKFAIRLGSSEYEAKVESAEGVFNARKMSRDKSILRY